MTKSIQIIGLMLLLCLMGCPGPRFEKYTWTGETGVAQLEQDTAACEKIGEEDAVRWYMSTSGLIPRARAESVYEQCMIKRGYKEK
jgi:hypothetical protein